MQNPDVEYLVMSKSALIKWGNDEIWMQKNGVMSKSGCGKWGNG